MISLASNSLFEAETTVAVAPDGRVAAVWRAFASADDRRIGVAFSRDWGDRWSPARVLAPDPGRFLSDPVVTVDRAGAFHFVWMDHGVGMPGTDGKIYVASAPAGSTELGQPVLVGELEGTTMTDKPWISATAGGGLLVTYTGFTASKSGIVAATSRDGVTWSSARIAPRGATALTCPSADGPRVYVANFQGSLGSESGRIEVRSSDDDGLTWSDPVTASDPSELVDQAPYCVAAGNDVWVMYGAMGDAVMRFRGLRLAHSGDGGRTFTTTKLDAPPYQLASVLGRSEYGHLDVVYYQSFAGIDGGTDLMGARRRIRSRDGGTSFDAPGDMGTPIRFDLGRYEDSTAWLGDYTGLQEYRGVLFTTHVVNADGVSHVAFSREPAL